MFRRRYSELTDLVPIVWLPVSRRLPVTEEDEERYTRTNSIESVDLRLNELLDELSDYHSGLNAQLSKRYKEFEHQVLSVMLYNKEHDQLDSIPSSSPTKAEKEQLLGAFEAAGLLNKQMQRRIDEHLAAAEEVLKRFHETDGWDIEDILVLPLIGRTKAMVEYAEELEKDREQIFAPLQLYEKTVNSFLDGKSVEVDEGGKLRIESSALFEIESSPPIALGRSTFVLGRSTAVVAESNTFVPSLLSSGEKQILILLTQALLKVDEPVVILQMNRS